MACIIMTHNSVQLKFSLDHIWTREVRGSKADILNFLRESLKLGFKKQTIFV